MSGSCGESVCRTTEILTRFPDAKRGRERGLGGPPQPCPENVRFQDTGKMPEADPDEEAGPGAPSAVPRLPQALTLTCEDRRPWGTAINGALMPPTVFWTLPGAPK